MTTVADLHNEAMEFTELAFLARMRGEQVDSMGLFQKALEHELDAIDKMSERVEPTFSVLCRSAATLALDCNEFRKAEQIVTRALSQDIPEEIAEELRDLLEQVRFKRHLTLRNVTLEDDEIRMSLAGQGVGFGVVKFDEFLSRATDTSKMILRIVERKQHKPFRERGRPEKSLRDNYELFLSLPRAAGFSVTLKIGRPAQQFLPGLLLEPAVILDEFMDLIDLANRSQFEEIKKRIPDPAYFRNFVALSKKIAPDGKNIRQVGFTAIRAKSERFVELTKPSVEFPPIAMEDSSTKSEHVIVRGVLLYADGMHADNGLIKVIEEETKKTHTVMVPEGIMSDIVRPMWDSVIEVEGKREGNLIILEDIREAPI